MQNLQKCVISKSWPFRQGRDGRKLKFFILFIYYFSFLKAFENEEDHRFWHQELSNIKIH